MISFAVTTTIDAPADAVWTVLTDTERWTEWDSGVLRVDGRVGLGNRLAITSAVNPDRAFRAKVTTVDAPRHMVWAGGMPLGLFRGVRSFTLTPASDVPAGTSFTMREEFSGPLLRLIGRTLPDLQPSFEQFAAGLKARVERNHPGA